MTVGAVGASGAPQLQTSWTRAEAACAARHRGDTYYALTHPAPPEDRSDASASGPSSTAIGATGLPHSGIASTAASTSAAPDVQATALSPGFSLYL